LKKIISLILFIFILTFIFCSISFAQKRCVCYYLSDSGGWSLPYDTCVQYSYLMQSLGMGLTDIKPLESFNFLDANSYEVVYLSGYGLIDGFFTKYSVDAVDSTRIPWKDLAEKIDVDLLLVDACFSGYIFDYNNASTVVITSANKTPSWNVILDKRDNLNVSSFVIMLRCIFDVNYDCPINVKQCAKYNSMWFAGFIDPQECQFNLIVEKTIRNTYMNFSMKTDPVVGITTTYINGIPWR